MQRLDDCGEPFEHPWSGGVLQVWVSDSARSQPVRVQLGHRDGPHLGDRDDRLIDFRGTIDVGAPPRTCRQRGGSSLVRPPGLRAAGYEVMRRRVGARRPGEVLPAPADSEQSPRLVVPLVP